MQITGSSATAFMHWLPLLIVVVLIISGIVSLVKNTKRKLFRKKIDALKIGDKVVTVRGLEGTVVRVGDDTVDLRYDDHCASFIKEAIDKIL